jgi:hypothetical protein
MRFDFQDILVAIIGIGGIVFNKYVAQGQTAIILRIVGEVFARKEKMIRFYRAMSIVAGILLILVVVIRQL